MNSSPFIYTSITVFVALTLAITMSPTYIGNMGTSYAQPTFDTPSSPGSSSPDTGSSTGTGAADDGQNFQQFMECLFGGEASEEDISNALDGSSGLTPTEQEIRDCFAPLYNTGGAAGSTTATTPGSGSAGVTQDAAEGDGDGDGDEDEGEGSANGGTSEDEDESEE
jgi:hypothetical protein